MTDQRVPVHNGRIRPRERDAIVASLRAGMVPRIGQQHIQVARAAELRAAITDVDRIAGGGAGCRFVIGEYGSGKTFFLHLVRSIALEKRLVAVHADLSPDRRLHAASGQARGLYAELMRNLASRARPDGGALASVVERFVTGALDEANASGDNPADTIKARLAALAELAGGYDFATVVGAYWRGYDSGDERLRADAVRWLRGEFTSRVDARAALGVRTIVDDATVYDHLKLMARFVRLAGFNGLLVCLDEMVNLYKITGSAIRNANYEQVLRIVNDTAQGGAEHIGFLFGGTPEFLMDPRRGLFSYPALASRLAPNRFASADRVDYSGPVTRLGNLTPEDVFVLLTKLRHVYAGGDPQRYLVPDEALAGYMAHCATRLGDAFFRTPRETIRGFLDLLALLEQHSDLHWSELVRTVDLSAAGSGSTTTDDDELTSFRL
ncbi:MAG TPA: ATP-binding protein [Rugosimonospora sp.]|nr:ATP-binding protein [Rugosimonospora sp.]